MPEKPWPDLTPDELAYLEAVRADIDRLVRLNLMGEISDEEFEERMMRRTRERIKNRKPKGKV